VHPSAWRGLLAATLLVSAADAEERASRERYRPREPNYLWPTLEMATILACGAGWYVLDRKTNQVDWDDPPLLARFDGDAWRLDTNRFGINFVGHPLTGALSYGVARGHDLTPAEAFSFSFATSLAWELGVEFREKVSLNDVLLTAPAGVPVGELAYRSVLEAAAKIAPEDPLPEDARGRFVAGTIALVAGEPHEAPGAAGRFGRIDAQGAFVWLPGYRARGSFGHGFWQAEHLTYRASAGASASGALFDGDATSLLAGYAAQSFEAGDAVRRAFVVGVPLGFRYRAASLLGMRELLAATRFPGVGFEARVEGASWSLELSGEASFHLSGLSAPSARGWAPLEAGQVGKSVLRREGYFYGVGPAASLRLGASWELLTLASSVGWLAARSLDGLDRAQEALTVDEVIRTDRLEASGRVRVAWPASAWGAFVGAELVRWRSRIDDERADGTAISALVGVDATY
jgi:hypothetical protein